MSAIAPIGASRCSTEGKFLRMFTVDVPPEPGTVATNGNTLTGARLAQAIGALTRLHAAGQKRAALGESTFPGRV
jgi:hypothetical protein